jgi:hypothetical protein
MNSNHRTSSAYSVTFIWFCLLSVVLGFWSTVYFIVLGNFVGVLVTTSLTLVWIALSALPLALPLPSKLPEEDTSYSVPRISRRPALIDHQDWDWDSPEYQDMGSTLADNDYENWLLEYFLQHDDVSLSEQEWIRFSDEFQDYLRQK